MPCRALRHHCLLLTYLHKCLSMFLASLFSLKNNSGGGQGEASPCYSLWGGQRPTNSSFWVCGPISLQLQQLCNVLLESLTAMEKCIPDLSTLHETSKIRIDIFPQFHFKAINVLQCKKKLLLKNSGWALVNSPSVKAPVSTQAFVHGGQMYQRRGKQSSHKHGWNTLPYVSWRLGTKYFVCKWKKKNEVKVPYNE